MLDDVRFILHDVLGEPETYDDVLAGAAAVCRELLAPLNATGDAEGATFDAGAVRTPAGFREAFATFARDGWVGLTAKEEHGGAGLPHVVGSVLEELVCAANLSFATYAGLTSGAYRVSALIGEGGPRPKNMFSNSATVEEGRENHVDIDVAAGGLALAIEVKTDDGGAVPAASVVVLSGSGASGDSSMTGLQTRFMSAPDGPAPAL